MPEWNQRDLLEADDADRGATVMAVHASAEHHFSKQAQPSIMLLQGLGVQDDAHAGAKVQHRYDKARDPTRPNLRQVHLLQSELFEELRGTGFTVRPGDLGENITTRGLDILALPESTRLHIGPRAIVEITGLRTPCVYIDRFRKGLLAAVRGPSAKGNSVHQAGLMAIVVRSGVIKAGEAIEVELPVGDHRRLRSV